MIALDLTDGVAPAEADAAAASLLSVVRKKADAAALGKLFATVRGVTFSAKATDQVRAGVRVDFGANPLRLQAVREQRQIDLSGAALA